MRTATPKKQLRWRYEWLLAGEVRWSSSTLLCSFDEAERLARQCLARSPGSRARVRLAEVRFSPTAQEVLSVEQLQAAIAALPGGEVKP